MVVLGMITPVHEDERRSIAEFDSPAGGFSVQSFQIKESQIPLGNHYHGDKDEIFVITEGRGIVFFAEVNRDKFKAKDIFSRIVSAGSVIKIPAYTAHALVLKTGSKMICFSTKPFDADDLHPCKVI